MTAAEKHESDHLQPPRLQLLLTRRQLNAIYESRPPSTSSPVVLIQWPPAPPNSTPHRSIVQGTVNATAKGLGLPPGVPPPIIAREPMPKLSRRPPEPITGFEPALPDLILPLGVNPPWEDDPSPRSITSPPLTPPEITALRAGFSSIKIELPLSSPPLSPDQQTHPVDTPRTPDAHPSKRRRIGTNLDRPTSSAQPSFQGGTPSLSLGSNVTPPRASVSRESPSALLNTSFSRPYAPWHPDEVHQQSHHDEQFDRYTPGV